MVFSNSKNALYGRFFIPLVLLTQNSFSASPLPDACTNTNFDDEVKIEKVIDGDTVILTDQRHVRLVGIDTPELDHDNYSRSEKGALLAKNRLLQILDTDHAYLQYDTERFDRHGRTLAHLYLANGINVQAILLEEGLAIPLAIPPNLKNQNCYSVVSRSAKLDKRGLWQLAIYKARNVTTLTGNERGFHIIRGIVKKVSESKSSIWINLENNVALRIVKTDLKYFNIDELKSFTNNNIEASGWLYKKNNQTRIRIRHPSNIKIDPIRN